MQAFFHVQFCYHISMLSPSASPWFGLPNAGCPLPNVCALRLQLTGAAGAIWDEAIGGMLLGVVGMPPRDG